METSSVGRIPSACPGANQGRVIGHKVLRPCRTCGCFNQASCDPMVDPGVRLRLAVKRVVRTGGGAGGSVVGLSCFGSGSIVFLDPIRRAAAGFSQTII